jgi:hypothetical protein
MRILLKFVVDCDTDAAWRALHSPQAMAELYGPLLTMEVEPRPSRWEDGDDLIVQVRAAGRVLVGSQLIAISDRVAQDGDGPVRILRDSGIPLTGPLAALTGWDHQMAVSPDPDDPTRTLWRERLVIRGPVAPLLWPLLWATWQWRATRIRALAPGWAHDPESDAG